MSQGTASSILLNSLTFFTNPQCSVMYIHYYHEKHMEMEGSEKQNQKEKIPYFHREAKK